MVIIIPTGTLVQYDSGGIVAILVEDNSRDNGVPFALIIDSTRSFYSDWKIGSFRRINITAWRIIA